jgi:hypothetical protein
VREGEGRGGEGRDETSDATERGVSKLGRKLIRGNEDGERWVGGRRGRGMMMSRRGQGAGEGVGPRGGREVADVSFHRRNG